VVRTGRIFGDPDEDSPYTADTLARLALSVAAHELADFAREFVPIDGEHGAPDGTLFEDALRLLSRAERVVELAVVYERLAGTGWPVLGEVLGMTKQSAHERYAEAEKRFREALAEPETTSEFGMPYNRLPAGADDPDGWADRLDRWVRRHREAGAVDHDEHPVTAGLRRMDPFSEVMELDRQIRGLLDEYAPLPLDRLAAIYERQAVLYDRLDDAVTRAGSGRDAAHNREAAATCRARAAELRATIAATTPANPSAPSPEPGPQPT
jgi:hypothetical protein